MAVTRSRRKMEDNDAVFDVSGGNAPTFLSSRSIFHDIVVLGACTSAGVVFGVALEKGRVFEPSVIQDQMLMKRFVMMKMFLSAVSSGMFCLSALSMIPATQKKLMHSIGPVYTGGLKNKGLVSMVLGASILGSGMTLAGACPGMVLAQVGSGTHNAIYTLAGGIAGAALYGVVEPYATQLLKPRTPFRHHSLHSYLHSPYCIIALPFASMLAIAVFGLELFIPWGTEVATPQASSVLSMRAWPPAVAGLLIGLLQIPVVLLVGDTIGSSSSFCTVASIPLVTKSYQKFFPYLAKFRSGLENWWQVFYVGGAVIGGFVSAQTSGTWGTIVGVSPNVGFAGGLMMILGSRIAGGCTSGHGLSGIGVLSLLSFAAVPAMFAGAMGTAFSLNKFGLL